MAFVKNVQMFVRVFELGNMSAAARDQRTSPAVASARIADLEKHLGVRLFNRTTRALHPTEPGTVFYQGAGRILDVIADAESAVMHATGTHGGTIFIAAPLGVGRRLIAPAIPEFNTLYPEINIRLRLSDRSIDVTSEGLDLAFHIGPLGDSDLKIRVIADCTRVLCAAPAYILRRGLPLSGRALLDENHDCLNLRFPGAREFQWPLETETGVERFDISGPYESDDGDVLTDWALDGYGIILKPEFEISKHLATGALVRVAQETPPISTQLVCLSPSRKMRDPKVQLFADFMVAKCKAAIFDKGAPTS